MFLRKTSILLVLSILLIGTGCKRAINATNDQVETPVNTPVTVFITGTANYTVKGWDWDDYQVEAPENGMLEGEGYKRTYTPNPDFTGIDTIRFRLGTEGNYTNYAEVKVHVGAPSGRIDRHGFESFALRDCVRQAAAEEGAAYVHELRSIDCSGSTLLVGGTKFFWLDDVFDNCINCDRGIKFNSFSGLEEFTQLETIRIGKGGTADLTPIAAMSDLTELVVPSIDGSQVNLLANFTDLTLLAFNSSNLTDFSGVTGLSNLQSLGMTNLRSDELDFTSIASADWPALTSLTLSGDILSITGIESANLPALTELNLSAYSSIDLTSLASADLPQLERLNLFFMDEASIHSFIGNDFTSLRELSITGYDILSYQSLTQNSWPALESMTLLASRDVTDLAGTENLQLPSLKVLDLHDIDTLTDVSALLTWQMPQIETIILTRGQDQLPCSERDRVIAQFPDADVQTNIHCKE